MISHAVRGSGAIEVDRRGDRLHLVTDVGSTIPAGKGWSAPYPSKQWQTSFALVCAVCFAVWSLPVICLAQWFPLDYSRLITLYTELQQHPWRFLSPYAAGSGRYYPVYWLMFGVQSYFFRMSTGLYSCTVGLTVLATCVAIAGIVYRATRRWDATLGVVPLLYLGTPVPENVATIGKAEPFICLLMFAAMAMFFRQCNAVRNHGMTIVYQVLIAAAIALALWTKETSVVLLGFCVAGLSLAMGAWLWLGQHTWRDCARDYVGLLQSLICGVAIAKVPYVLFKATADSQGYTSYAITPKLMLSNAYFYLSQQPDVLAFGVASTILLGIVGWSLARQAAVDKHTAHCFLLFSAMTAMGWAYCAVLLIWRWPLGYYMLPASYAFRAAAVGCLFQALEVSQWRWPRRLFGVLVVVTTLYGAMYAWYVIGSQLSYSRLYTAMLQQVAADVPRGGRLLLESYPGYSEQAGGTHMWLKAIERPDIAVGGMADYLDPAVPTPEIRKLLNVTDGVLQANRERLPTTGDHIVVFTGEKFANWMVRGVTPYVCAGTLLAGIQGDFDLELVAEQELAQYAVYPHVWTGFPCASRTTLGYKLYEVKTTKPRFMWFDRYPDGWIGEKGTLTINSSTPAEALLRLSAPPFTIPNEVTVVCDGQAPVVVPLATTDEVVVPVRCECLNGSSVIDIRVAKVVAPRDLKINKDKRQLGIRAACDLVPTVALKEVE